MVKEKEKEKMKKKFENMKNYDNDDYYNGYNRSTNTNFNEEREKSLNYYNLLVIGRLLLNITVLIIFIIIV